VGIPDGGGGENGQQHALVRRRKGGDDCLYRSGALVRTAPPHHPLLQGGFRLRVAFTRQIDCQQLSKLCQRDRAPVGCLTF
jgi:hypothetical protein